jgi:hypothetical protein
LYRHLVRLSLYRASAGSIPVISTKFFFISLALTDLYVPDFRVLLSTQEEIEEPGKTMNKDMQPFPLIADS